MVAHLYQFEVKIGGLTATIGDEYGGGQYVNGSDGNIWSYGGIFPGGYHTVYSWQIYIIKINPVTGAYSYFTPSLTNFYFIYSIISDGTNLWFWWADTSFGVHISKMDTSGTILASYSITTLPGGTPCFDGTYIWWTGSGISYLGGGSNTVYGFNTSTGTSTTPLVLSSLPSGSTLYNMVFDGTKLWVGGGNGSIFNFTVVTAIAGGTTSTYNTVSIGSETDALYFDGTTIWCVGLPPDIVGVVASTSAVTTYTVSGWYFTTQIVGLITDGTYFYLSNGVSNSTLVVATTGATPTVQTPFYNGVPLPTANSIGLSNGVVDTHGNIWLNNGSSLTTTKYFFAGNPIVMII